jgi:hypothetical protein
VPSKSFVGKRPQFASASKAKTSILSQLSGLEHVLFNGFINDELDSGLSAREEDEIAALDAVGDYEADPTVVLEDVLQDIVFKTLKVSCACVAVLVYVCVRACVFARARRRYLFLTICICFF